ncbi:MAG: c-type cytochrome biogenesis protein CcmI [Gammaproteobacteria bacterium]|nr:c-type cytochrome biogenesis protein CcmI [Gammaproteobacteria bacterium]
MNIMFWVLMILMLLLAIGLLVFPLLKLRQTSSSFAYKESNLKINDEKIKELDLDLEEGRIDQVFYKSAREELDRELLIDIPAENQQTAALHYTGMARRHPVWAIMISIFVPMLALLLYLELGMHTASDDSFVAAQQQSQQRPGQTGQQPSIDEMVLMLEQRIEKNGGTVEEWTMLARAHKYLGKYELAAKAFAVALEKDTGNAQLMLESVEMMALNNNRSFTPEARDLALKAYAIQPDNANALWFAGVAEYQYKNYRQAIDHLTALLPLAGDDQDVVKSVMTIVAKSREQLIAAGEEMPELQELMGIKPMAKPDSQPATAKAKSPEATPTKLNVNVDVSDEVRKKFSADDTIFVYAKAKQGPRMPLAAQRMTLAELPTMVVLDDSMAMVDGMNLSAFDQLEVSARLTKSGAAIAQSGDYIGRITVEDKATQTMLNIVIDTAIP